MMTAVGVNEVEQHHGPVRYGFSRGRAVWAGMDLVVSGARFRWPLATHEGSRVHGVSQGESKICWPLAARRDKRRDRCEVPGL